MATADLSGTRLASASAAQTLTYPQAMWRLDAVVTAMPTDGGIVLVKARQHTVVKVQAGQHYKVRRLVEDSTELETPDNLYAVRRGDALHLRYADGSVATFEDFFATCTNDTVCSVNVAGNTEAGFDLSALNITTGTAVDDGLLVYSHGAQDVLMAMVDMPSKGAVVFDGGASLSGGPFPFLAGVGFAAAVAGGGKGGSSPPPALPNPPGALAIDVVAGDDTINAQEVGSTVTGTNAIGSTVTLTVGGVSRVATVTGSTWSYAAAGSGHHEHGAGRAGPQCH